MKKNNVIIFALLAAVSAFLLWLWYFLGFNRIDDPLDLALSILWWAMIVVAIVVVVKTEQVRRRRVRTVYVGERATFNSEKGLMAFAGEKTMYEVIASILDNLEYDFSREDFPEKDKLDVKYFVRTKEFEAEKRDEASSDASTENAASSAAASGEPADQRKWKGEVVIVETKEEKPFETPEELASILATLEQAA